MAGKEHVTVRVELVKIEDGCVYFRSDDGSVAYRRVGDMVPTPRARLPVDDPADALGLDVRALQALRHPGYY